MGGANKQPPFADQRLEAIVTVRKREKSAAANHISDPRDGPALGEVTHVDLLLPKGGRERGRVAGEELGACTSRGEAARQCTDHARERRTEKRRERAPDGKETPASAWRKKDGVAAARLGVHRFEAQAAGSGLSAYAAYNMLQPR